VRGYYRFRVYEGQWVKMVLFSLSEIIIIFNSLGIGVEVSSVCPGFALEEKNVAGKPKFTQQRVYK
jgi:hypothetical protein